MQLNSSNEAISGFRRMINREIEEGKTVETEKTKLWREVILKRLEERR